MPTDLARRLARGVLLCDGAKGTELLARAGHTPEHCPEILCLTQPDLVRAVHLDYLRAGAELIETNSFNGNAVRLAHFGLADQFVAINRSAAGLALEARRLTGQDVWVAGAMGPLGPTGVPFNMPDASSRYRAFADQAAVLAEAGVDILELETFGSLSEMELAIRAVQSATSLPLIAQMLFEEDGNTPAGETPEEVVTRLQELGVAVVGSNCGLGPELALQVLEHMATAATVPLAARPSAGRARYENGHAVYSASPAYMAERAKEMVSAGALAIGGCHGTGPAHIAAMRDAVRGIQPPVHAPQRNRPATPTPAKQRAKPEPTSLEERLRAGRFVVTVEVDPPRGFDISDTLDRLRRVAGAVDAINVADSPRAQGRLGALATSSLIQSRLGIETILHMAIRHRNLLALHSDLLGAHALGVRNIFAVMGDVPATGDYPEASAVADITTSGLIKLLDGFNNGVDAGGKPIDQPTTFLVGCALNLSAPNMDRELRILERKVAAGARFLLTQPVYDPEVVERLWQRLGGFPVPLLLGVLPLRSARHARFLANEVPGISVPPSVIERMHRADQPAAEGLAVSQELLRAIHGRISGTYFIPPFQRYRVVTETLSGIDIPGLRSTA